MTRLSLALIATTAMCSPAFAMSGADEGNTVSEVQSHATEAAETVENGASEVYDRITEEISDAAAAVESATTSSTEQAAEVGGDAASAVEDVYNSAVETTKKAYAEAIDEVEHTKETLAARAEMGEARVLTPIDLDNRSDFIRASDIIGADIYTARAAMEPGAWREATRIADDWDNIGNVVEMVVGPDGNLRGLVAEVGGVLGMGDAHVLIEMSDLHRTMPDDDGNFAFVTWMSEEDLKNERPVEKDWWQIGRAHV